jgi:hypothetical protein
MTAYPPKRLYQSVAAGTVNVWLGTKGVPDYDGKVLYSDFSVVDIELCAFSLGITPPARRKEDLAGHIVITIWGYAYAGLIGYLEQPENRITTYVASTHETGFSMLERGRAAYLIDYALPASQTLREHPIPGLVKSTLSIIPTYFVVSKATPDAAGVLRRIEQAYHKLGGYVPSPDGTWR